VRPSLLVIAGPNGSGKTSLTRFLQQRGYDFGLYINPDDIAGDLTGDYEERVRQAQALADKRRKDAISTRQNFSFETVFSHPSKLDDLEAARKAGFEITLFFIGVASPIINIERVRTRVALGGHDVPQDRIAARYVRTMELLIEMVKRVDRAVILDNSLQSNNPFSFKGRVVAEYLADDKRLIVTERLPVWTISYLIEPAVRLGWIIIEANYDVGDLKALNDIELLAQLAKLRREIRDLDAAIASLQDSSKSDAIQIRRLQRRRVRLRDRIAFIEDSLTPDSIA
jgi:predicted ABC-type ATPase